MKNRPTQQTTAAHKMDISLYNITSRFKDNRRIVFVFHSPTSQVFDARNLLQHGLKRNMSHRFFAGLVLSNLLLLILALPAAGQGTSPTRLTIIGPRDWLKAMQDYASARSADVKSVVVAWENLIESQTGVDEPEKIKRFLYSQWKKNEIHHVLLVGDASVTPVRYMVLDRVTPAAFDYAFYPSDLYFADLTKTDGSFETWNAVSEGHHAQYFGEVRGEKNKTDPINFDQIDYRPEIGVGRWPARTLEELKTIAAKSLEYEKQTKLSEPPVAAFVAVDGWVDSRPSLDQAAQHLSGWTIEKRYYVDGQRNDKTEPPSANEVAALFGKRNLLLFHAGHGHPDHWHDCISLKQLSQVETAGQWPIVLSAGCSTAVFAPQAPYEAYIDTAGVKHHGTNGGEQFSSPPPAAAAIQPAELGYRSMGTDLLVATPHGAVAYFGCATGSQPCGLTLLTGFAAAAQSNSQKEPIRLGDAYRKMIDHYVEVERLAELQPTESWYPPSIFFQGMKFVLFGDPSLKIPQT